MLISIDPSSAPARVGWAIFDSHTLVQCGKVTPPPAWLEGVTQAVIERPRIYPHGRTPNPNDVLKVAIAAGEAYGALAVCGVQVTYVEPRTWKRTLDPDTCCRRVWGRLRDEERYVAADYEPEPRGHVLGGKDHVLDAIGIGLWAIGRLDLVCAVSSAARAPSSPSPLPRVHPPTRQRPRT